MAFTASYAEKVLTDIFKAGNRISLTTGTNPESESYSRLLTKDEDYIIKSSDFAVSNRCIYNTKHLLCGLAEADCGTADGFIVTGADGVMYIARLTEPITIEKDTVPVFKKAFVNGGFTGEGIRVSLDNATASATTE